MDRLSFEFNRLTVAWEDKVKSLVQRYVSENLADLIHTLLKQELENLPVSKVQDPVPSRRRNQRVRIRVTGNKINPHIMVYEAIRRHKNGAKMSQLVGELKMNRGTIFKYLDSLRTEGKIRLVGQKRFATWHVV